MVYSSCNILILFHVDFFSVSFQFINILNPFQTYWQVWSVILKPVKECFALHCSSLDERWLCSCLMHVSLMHRHLPIKLKLIHAHFERFEIKCSWLSYHNTFIVIQTEYNYANRYLVFTAVINICEIYISIFLKGFSMNYWSAKETVIFDVTCSIILHLHLIISIAIVILISSSLCLLSSHSIALVLMALL